MTVRRRGWTLIEVMVAVGLFSLVMLVVTGSLVATSRSTQSQIQRSVRQSALQSCLGHIEKLLQRTTLAGINWQYSAGSGAVLAAQCVQDGPITTAAPLTQPFWRCIVWDEQSRTLSMGESTLLGGYAAPDTTRYQSMPVGQMADILANETPPTFTYITGRGLADGVTHFDFQRETGALLRIDLELDVPTQHRGPLPDDQERLKASLKIHLRNRV